MQMMTPPASDAGAVLSIADKVDTIASFFAIGMIPSGSQDPYALKTPSDRNCADSYQKRMGIALEEIFTQAV